MAMPSSRESRLDEMKRDAVHCLAMHPAIPSTVYVGIEKRHQRP